MLIKLTKYAQYAIFSESIFLIFSANSIQSYKALHVGKVANNLVVLPSKNEHSSKNEDKYNEELIIQISFPFFKFKFILL